MRRALVVSAVLALSASGCLSPHLKVASNTPEPKPATVLVSGFHVRFDDASDKKSAIDAAVDMAQNAQLEDFGKRAAKMMEVSLAEYGFSPAYDGNRASRLDAIQLTSSSTTAALTGFWRHPDSSQFSPEMMEGLFVNTKETINRVRLDGKDEFYAFSDVVIRDYGILMRSPCVIVRTTVWNKEGAKVLDLQGIGWGQSAFWYSNRSAQNLETALRNGFDSLKSVKTESL